MVLNIEWMDSVRSEAYQTAKVAAKAMVKKIAVVRNAVDVAKFADPNLAPASLPDSDSVDFQFAVVANMHGPTKGHKFLIEAAQQVCRLHPRVRFVLVGDGELRASLQDSVRSLGLQRNFLFLGGRTDVANILRAVDVSFCARAKAWTWF